MGKGLVFQVIPHEWYFIQFRIISQDGILMLFYKIPWSTLNVPWVTNVVPQNLSPTKWKFFGFDRLDRLMKRKRLTVCRITTSDRELSRDAPIQINQFLTECEPYMQMDFRDSFLNADETSIYIDPPTKQSVALIGSRRGDADRF
jgi:hypothetical protein